jgi:hypothetical protein
MNGIYSLGRAGEKDGSGPGGPFGAGAGNFPLSGFSPLKIRDSLMVFLLKFPVSLRLKTIIMKYYKLFISATGISSPVAPSRSNPNLSRRLS